MGDENYADFVKGFSPDSLKSGPIVDIDGKVIGEHKGIAFYTIGQRKGLGISSPVPRYVADINRETNAIVIGSREDAARKRRSTRGTRRNRHRRRHDGSRSGFDGQAAGSSSGRRVYYLF